MPEEIKHTTTESEAVALHRTCSPVGARSGLPFETIRQMARSKRMELGRLSRDPFYYHTHDCQGCEQECNGLDGRHIADDAKDIVGWANDGDEAAAGKKSQASKGE